MVNFILGVRGSVGEWPEDKTGSLPPVLHFKWHQASRNIKKTKNLLFSILLQFLDIYTKFKIFC